MRRSFPPAIAALALGSALALACTDAAPTSPWDDQVTRDAVGPSAAAPERPFGGTCTFAATFLPPEPGQPPNVQLIHIDEVCHLRHLGLTTASAEETVTFTDTGPVFTITSTYTAANGDQLFTTSSGTGTFPDQNGIVTFSGTETVTGGTGRFADASGSFSFTASVNVVTRTGQIEFISGTLSY